MIYLKQDFFSNFSNSLKYGDIELANDILLNELSDIITYHPDNFVKLLNTSDIKADIKKSDEELIDLFLENFGENAKLQRGFAFVVAQNNQLINAKTNHKKARQTVDKLAKGLIPTVENIVFDDTKKKFFRSNLIDAIKVKDSKTPDRKRLINKPSQNGKKIIIFIILGVGIYLLWHYRKKFIGSPATNNAATQTKAANGLEIPNEATAQMPVQQPVKTDAEIRAEKIKAQFANLDGDTIPVNVNVNVNKTPVGDGKQPLTAGNSQ